MDGIPAIPHQRNHPEAARRHPAAAPDATAGVRPGSPADPPDTAGGADAGTPATASAGTPDAAADATDTAATPDSAATAATPAQVSAQAPAAAAGPDVTGAADAYPASARTGTRFAVLGPIRAWRGSEALPSGTPQQRALLAALLLRGGRTATAPELIDAIWGEDPPQQALATIRTYASRLRKVLAPGMLVSESGGYAIRTPTGTLDLGIARSLAADADQARTAGDRTLARTLLARALDLWDGEPLAGVPGPHAETERTRLAEWHLQLLETRLDLDLELGHHAEAVSELTALTAAHPLQERLRELLMLALYRSGRQAEALAVYADTRRLLADELGVDPRPELSALQQRILRADAELARAEDPAPAAAPAHVRPAQLPATVADFTGRATFVNELGEILSGVGGQVMAVSALAGIGGVGKTTLAVHVAHAARPHFPDGQLYVDLQGTEPRPAEPVAVLGSFLRALGTPDTAIPDTAAERAALYRSTLDGRRVLVLLDNARDAAQVRPLLPGTAGCAALVTSRVRMAGLAGAHLVDLDVMSPEEALQLFTRIVGAERVGAERQAALDVVGACGFLPLAIRIAASRLAARRTWTVSVLAAKLADGRRRLDELQAGDLAVKATFELGYGQLEPAQQRAFRLLGLADGPDISLAAAAAVLDRPEHDTEDLLEALVDCSLLESAAPGRYRFHDLVRLYARACADRDEQPPSGRDAALDRLLDFYLATASAVYAVERPGDRLPAHLSATHYPGLRFTEPRAALDWLYAEADPLLACVRQASVRTTGQADVLRRAVDLLWAAKDLAESGANSKQYESAAVALRDAAHAAKDPHAEGRARTTLTNVHLVAGRFDEADDEARQAMVLAREAGDPLPSCWAPNDRGIIALYQGRHADGERYLLEAIENFRADGNHIGEASALCNLSRIHVELGRLTSAIDLAEQGIAIYDRMGLTLRLANGRYALGIALTQAGRLGEAQTQLTEALSLFHDNRQPLWEGVTHFRLAVAHLAAHRPTLAAAHAEQAIALRGIGGEWRRATVLTVLGKALRRLGQRDRARVCWRDAEVVFKQLKSAELAEVQALLASEIAA
ncbi:BTAD domain-containing putative transcriptional regulator [Streptomyces sp. NBC_01443]|uniref:AfsR/SARP family transcriptional regulator n=1 Tax=Streptomyces sp. NBC_01443 TaxID=2903868 RepID=UPI002256B8AB|nr:BTAD domain-containing putative transcriptional regulator [Streptomyces sp. NBC_01443]MCX4629304.1 tetratricopeptide repeat protein [Streptomyces sp. NBC_01443]